jgi:acyl-CoA dehydrogenase
MDFRLPPDLVEWQQTVRDFVLRELQPHDEEIERTGVVPPELVRKMAERGLFGANTPRDYGGLGLSMLGACLGTAELAKAHIAFYYRSGINAHIGSKPIELDGSEAQKRRWLPELASGRTIAALALTEPEAGSDAASIRTTARRDGDAYVLDGRKIYITNAAEAGLFTVFATVDPSAGARGVTAFLVEAGTPGLVVERLIEMMGAEALRTERWSSGNAVYPSPTGSVPRVRDSPRRCAASTRDASIGAPTASASRSDCWRWRLAAPRSGINSAARSGNIRRSPSRSPTWRRRSTRLGWSHTRPAWRYDQDPKDRQLSGALSKLIGADMVGRVADQTLQIFGGAGYSKDYPVERIWREARVVRILDGTSEMMRRIVARHALGSADS